MLNTKQKLSQTSGNELVPPPPKTFKLSSSIGKVMLVAFWNSRGIILAHCMPKSQTVTARYYSEVVLKKEISKKN